MPPAIRGDEQFESVREHLAGGARRPGATVEDECAGDAGIS
jgi:hypothetical protein